MILFADINMIILFVPSCRSWLRIHMLLTQIALQIILRYVCMTQLGYSIQCSIGAFFADKPRALMLKLAFMRHTNMALAAINELCMRMLLYILTLQTWPRHRSKMRTGQYGMSHMGLGKLWHMDHLPDNSGHQWCTTRTSKPGEHLRVAERQS